MIYALSTLNTRVKLALRRWLVAPHNYELDYMMDSILNLGDGLTETESYLTAMVLATRKDILDFILPVIQKGATGRG